MTDIEGTMGGEHAAFYAEHYSDWTVHELPLLVYVPSADDNRAEALALVREILDEASFDIRVSEGRVMPPDSGQAATEAATLIPHEDEF